ncbi:MAG: hypothetical protein ACREJD_15640 [Phycisphaerales bacterium]
MIPVSEGTFTADIVTERIGGVGNFNYDFNDGVGYTIVNILQ